MRVVIVLVIIAVVVVLAIMVASFGGVGHAAPGQPSGTGDMTVISFNAG